MTDAGTPRLNTTPMRPESEARDAIWAAPLSWRERQLVEALRAMPCYGCSTTPGDNSADAMRRSRGCVTCGKARATLAKLPKEPTNV